MGNLFVFYYDQRLLSSLYRVHRTKIITQIEKRDNDYTQRTLSVREYITVYLNYTGLPLNEIPA